MRNHRGSADKKPNVVRCVFLKTTLDAVWLGIRSRGWRQEDRCRWRPVWGPEEGGGGLYLGGISGDGVDVALERSTRDKSRVGAGAAGLLGFPAPSNYRGDF